MGTPFVSIHNARWEIHLDDAIIHTFPESGAGLMEFFRLHEIREVMCSSSVDFPEEESALNAKQASEILQTDPETAANTLVCLIHQTNYLLDQQLRQLERQFLEKGGFTERLYRARTQARARPFSQ